MESLTQETNSSVSHTRTMGKPGEEAAAKAASDKPVSEETPMPAAKVQLMASYRKDEMLVKETTEEGEAKGKTIVSFNCFDWPIIGQE